MANILRTILLAAGFSCALFASPVFATDSTINLTLSGEVVLNLGVSDETGTFGASSEQTITITSDHYSGYTLSITGSDDNGQLVGATDSSNYFSSITSEISESTFSSDSSYNNMWGFLPSKYKSADNSNYLPAPTTTATVLDQTSSASDEAATYTLAIGARANIYTKTDSYSNTFVIAAVGNPSVYEVTYAANTSATVSNLPSTTIDALDGASFTVSSTSPTRSDGYAFAGWCAGTATADSTDCDGTTIVAGGTYIFSEVDQTALNSVTLYALWELEAECPGGYICYSKNGADGETTMANQSASASSSVMLLASNFSYTDHGFLGWSTVSDPIIGEDTIYGPNETITTPSTLASEGLKLYAVWLEKSGTMQNFTTCSALTAATYDSGVITVTANTFTALEDSRDGEVYAVARLTDGNCWMLENLRLDDSATLTSENTNNPAISSLTAASTGWCTSSSAACDDQSLIDTTSTTSTAATSSSASDNIYSYGTYFNWYSATAGNGTYSVSSGTVSGDICPSGWQLPVGNSSTASGSVGYLSISMGGLSTYMSSSSSPTGATMSARLRSFPNNYVYSGGHWSSSIDNRGTYGHYWTSTAVNNKSNAYRFTIASAAVNPGTNYGIKAGGFAVRCLAGS